MQATPNPKPSLDGVGVESAVTLTLPARHDQLPILRLLTEAVAMRNNCTLDQAADLKLAIDQIGTLLISVATPGTTVTCHYVPESDCLQTSLTAVTDARWEPERGSIEWRMLSALADSVTITQEATTTGETRESTVTVRTGKLT